ncbi:hypothetical protein DPMN_177752 [Dreissena polymorpha]|uniref:Uncharacterized protein n=1 Tax=Dreissena polymorpha TaxID=45954 RepID=A0A9D4IJ99_DREPO|nr:hypothetical protein DPMN_177752 [Dreissena polymorpha]
MPKYTNMCTISCLLQIPTVTPQEEEEMVENITHIRKRAMDEVTTNIDTAHRKQQKDFKMRQTKKYVALKEGDRVLLLCAKTATRKGNLQANYTGPYTIDHIQGKTACLLSDGQRLKQKVSLDRLKQYVEAEAVTSPLVEGPTTQVPVKQPDEREEFVSQTAAAGQLDQLSNIILQSGLLQQLPSQTLIDEVILALANLKSNDTIQICT